MTGAAFSARVRHAVAVAPVEYAFTAEPSRGRLPAGSGAHDPSRGCLFAVPDTPGPLGERHLAGPHADDPHGGCLPAVPDIPLAADPCRPAERPWAGVADILLCCCGHAAPSPREAGRALLRAYPGCLVAGVHGPDGRSVLVSPRGLVLVTPVTSAGRAERGAHRWGTVAAAVLVYAWLVGGRDLTTLPDTVLRSARNPPVLPQPETGGDGDPAPERAPVPGRPPVHEVYVRAEPR
ncbi:hypothetical protein [Nocardiopsis deserti]|uniref:hypothetical protein n=1 Tax=Nocardiopsis deserti TaxID=2605988 RepID=UPI001CC237C8|nr:hypothetical protein [Nocardiopsis deserti]